MFAGGLNVGVYVGKNANDIDYAQGLEMLKYPSVSVHTNQGRIQWGVCRGAKSWSRQRRRTMGPRTEGPSILGGSGGMHPRIFFAYWCIFLPSEVYLGQLFFFCIEAF